MRTVGLIGKMRRESSPLHYQRVNRGIAALLGGLHSAECALYSVDFAEIEAAQSTMHMVYDDVRRL